MFELVRRWWRPLLPGVVGVALLGSVGVATLVGCQVRRAVAEARALEPGDPVAALLAVAASGEYDFATRNRAVWALGQIGDGRAEAPLAALLPAADCDHETGLCRHELDKALALCRGAPNPGAVLWRHGDLAAR